MKRRNVDSTKYYRKQFHFRKCKFDGIYGSNTFVYLKFLIVWIFIMIADFVLEFRFEFIWPLWLFTRSLYESLKYQGIIFSMFFALIVFLFDLLCYIFLPVQWLFFAAGTYVWVQYIWHNDLNLKEKGVCLPTISLWLLFVYIETSFRLKNIKTIDLCRPFAAHSIGYPMVTLGFGFKSYVAYKYRIKKQKYVQKSNDFYVQLITKALPIDVKLKNSLVYEEEISPCNNIPAVQNSNSGSSKQSAYNNTISTNNSKEKPMNINNQTMKISSPSGLIASALSYYLNSTSSSNTNNNNNNSLEYFQYIQQKETTVAPKLLKQLNSSSSDLTYLKNQYKSKERNSDASYNDVNVNVSDDSVNFSSISIQSLAYEPNMTSNSGTTNFSKINNKGNHHQRSASSSSTQSQFSEKGTVPLTSTNHTNININMTINATAIAAAAAQAATATTTTTTTSSQQTSSTQSSSSISRNSKYSRKNKESYREMSSTLSSSTLTNNSDSDLSTLTVQGENLEKLVDSSSTTEIDSNTKSASNFDLVNRLEEELKKMRIEIEQQKKVEQYLRTQINYITKCDRNEKLKLEKLQQENETLQSKISKMNIQKQKEKEELSAMEKRLQEEKQLRLALESQLSQEKQKRETSSSEQTIIEQNKRRIRELEMENSRLSNDCKCKQDRIGSLEVEMKSLGKYREAESRANTLEVKLSVMQEKTASLQESLSAETRFKMDLFSALGEARRQLEYATFQLEARERELNTFKSIFKQSLMLNNQSGSENDIISQYLANQLNTLQSSLMNGQNNNSFNKIGNSTNETSNGNGEDAVNKKGLTK